MTVEEFKDKYLDVIDERRNEFIIACNNNDYDTALTALITSMCEVSEVRNDIDELPHGDWVITRYDNKGGWCFVYGNYECKCYRIGETEGYCIQVTGKDDRAICDEVFNKYSYLGVGVIISTYERIAVQGLITRRSMEPYDKRKYDVE